MKKINVITIDGPSASGKGALARGIADRFGLNILDSGVLYRLYAYLFNMSFSSNEIANQIERHVEFIKSKEKLLVSYKKNDVTSELKSEVIAKSASEHSSKKEVRETLFNIQRNFYNGEGLVADGRDMGTVVFPNANLKIFLTASIEERAKRRHKQLISKGIGAMLPDLLLDLGERDKRDTERSISPLKPANDAVILDSTNLGIEEVVNKILQRFQSCV